MWLFWTAFTLMIVLAIVLLCARSLARKVPVNYILLLLFTLSEAYMVASITAFYDPQIVFAAISMTAGIVVGLTVYAMFTRGDITYVIGFIMFFCVTMILSLFFMLFWSFKAANTLLCALGVILYGFYLIYDTRLIMGQSSWKLQIDEYIVGAMILYIDIIMIFLRILALLGRK